jgi:tetratricopeptide (TPR) repeat protein
MIFRFGRFELEEGKRELRLGTRPLEMQPRVFDLLVYLVRNHERVVAKDELLSAIWPEVIVTDSSLMRAVSLIRSLLREGGQSDAIQTIFTSRLSLCRRAQRRRAANAAGSRRGAARTACEQGEWQQALQAFRKVHNARYLQAGDYEQWAYAALYVGQPNDAIYPLERAVAAHIQNANRVGAARAALTLTNVNLEGRAVPVAKGGTDRAGVFLTDEPRETREHGLHLWLSARIALFEGELDQALAYAKQAEALAGAWTILTSRRSDSLSRACRTRHREDSRGAGESGRSRRGHARRDGEPLGVGHRILQHHLGVSGSR